MARDEGLEEVMRDRLEGTQGITEKAMFGGRAWLLRGNLLCGAREDGALLRLGKGNDQWALRVAGVVPMVSQGRAMSGWVRVPAEVFGNDALSRKLVAAALKFTGTLPPK